MTTTFQDPVIPEMTPSKILDRLASLEVEVWAEGERLRYRAPKGQLSADLKDLLTQRKGELLSYLRQRERETVIASVPRIVPDPEHRYEPFPLTDLQQAYWVGRSGAFELGNVAPHFYLEADLPGLDLERFNAALVALIQRHDMLRAVVQPDGLQRILPEVPPYRIETVDLTGFPAAQSEAGLERVRREMSHQVLPTDRWPLFEIRASRLPGGRTRLHMSFDLLIGDVWSFQIFFRELFRLYRDPEAALPALELSFRDYVLAELAFQSSERYRKSQEYWWSRLPSLPAAPELPLALSPAELKKPRFTRRNGRLAAETWQALKGKALRSGLTPSGTLLAAFAEVLEVWSKSPRFTLNLTFFNRLPYHPQINDIMGDFSATLLLAIEGAGETFGARARELQQQLWQDLEHVHVSGVRVLRELARVRRDSTAAAMPVVFTSALHNTPGEAEQAEEQPWQPVYGVSQTPQVWLDHRVTEQTGALAFSWDVVEDLLPGGLLDAMFAAYTGLLERLAAGEGAWEEAAPVRIPESDLRLITAANATAAPVPAGLLHEGFLRQAGRRPDETAVASGGWALSYGELARRARLLGARLRELGLGPNRLVAVVMEKGWEQVVAVLGVLESGAAYLPIDAALPRERIWQLLELGEAAVAVTQPKWLEGLEWPEGVLRVPVKPEAEGDVPVLAPAQQPEDLAYVIFTSGSTGVPKGVMIDHRGALNTVEDVNRRFAVDAGDRVFALSSLAFDLSVYDIFGTLAAGGTIVMPEAWATREPGRWAEILEGAGVTVWNSVPALLEMFVEYLEGRGSSPGALRLAFLSGDWLPLSLPERVRRLWPQARVISLGGATEASIWSILYPIESVEPGWKSIPYGRAMVNQTFQVLDGRLEPRPLWVPGQLYIGGVGLALGYWRDQEKTAASFLIHPRTGERLYRTGDLGRWLPEGEIEFLGREDLQVKVQGHRVELGEIEAVLGRHPAVHAAVVKAVGDGRGGKRLAAYVVADGTPSAAGELRAFLRGHLPEYMVPAVVRFVDSLPLTANGKVDRAALPDPGDAPVGREAAAAGPAPSSALAKEIASRIARVLGLDRIDPEAQLMEMGMISVDMIRIANLIEKDLGFRPRIDDFYQLPTCAALADALADRGTAAPAAALPPQLPASVWESFDRVLDPDERLAFKAAQPGLRRLEEGTPGLALPPLAADAPHRERRTRRSFRSEAVPLASFGALLGGLRRISSGGEPRYLYPSAGGLYPVQTYVHVKAGRVAGLAAGAYYYDPAEHRLLALAPGAEIDRAIHAEFINRPVFDQAAFSLFLVAESAAAGPLYGKAGRDFALIEAGAMLQLLMTVAAGAGLGLCPVGSLDFAPVRPLLRLSGTHELLHSALGGIPAPEEGSSPPLWADIPAESAPIPRRTSVPAASAPLERTPRKGALPLSFAQRQLWFLHQLDPESPHYNSPVAVRLSGRLDTAALERALAEIVRRHESLRTLFHGGRGEPVQVVTAPGPMALPLTDLSGLPAECREALARRLVAEEIRRPFDLERGPVSRFRLLRLAETEHVTVVTIHHIASDYWSLGILIGEVSVLYEAFAAGRPSPLAELPVQYADFAFWQRRWLSEEVVAGQIEYWKRRLAGFPPVLALPTDHPRPPVQSFRGAVRSRVIRRDLAERIKAAGRTEGATPFMTLLATLAVLLHAFTGERDVLVGSPVASRGHADLEGLIGLFVNLLVFRTRLEGDPEFREVVRQVRQSTLEAQAHQDLPFGMVVEELRPERSLSHTPIFQVAYTFQDARQTAFDLPGLTLSPMGIETGTTQFDLILNVEDGPEGMTLALDHNTDLFESATILRLLASLEGILEIAAERPQVRLSELRARAGEIDRRHREAERAALESARRQSFQTIRRRVVTTTPEGDTSQ